MHALHAAPQVVPPGAPSQLEDLRPLPAGAFDNSTDLLELEGETYFWWVGKKQRKLHTLLQAASPCAEPFAHACSSWLAHQ